MSFYFLLKCCHVQEHYIRLYDFFYIICSWFPGIEAGKVWHAVFLDPPFAQFASKACKFQASHTYRRNLLHAKPPLNRARCRASTGPGQPCKMTKKGKHHNASCLFQKASVRVARSRGPSIVPSINSASSVCLHWAALHHHTGIFRVLYFSSFLCLICHGDSVCKDNACAAGGPGSGVQRQPACLLSGLVCSLNHVHSQVASAQANTDEETWTRKPKIQFQESYSATWHWIRKWICTVHLKSTHNPALRTVFVLKHILWPVVCVVTGAAWKLLPTWLCSVCALCDNKGNKLNSTKAFAVGEIEKPRHTSQKMGGAR